MSEEKEKTMLITDFKYFRGFDFTIQSTDQSTEMTKRLNLISMIKFVDHIKANMKYISYQIQKMITYRNYAAEIDKNLDEDENCEIESSQYNCGGNFAFFLDSKSNYEACEIIESKYKDVQPDNKLIFDSESGFCYVYSDSRDEAKQFMIWMNDNYIKPWVDKNIDGWDELVDLLELVSEEDKKLFMYYIEQW